MGKELSRFKILLIKEKDSDFYPFSFFSNFSIFWFTKCKTQSVDL